MNNTDMLPELSYSNLKRHLIEWDEIGRKWPGTPGEKEVKQYCFDEMKGYPGVEVKKEEFEYLKWFPINTEVETLEPTRGNLTCGPVAYYANGSIEGELVYVGSGTREEFKTLQEQGVDFKGKVVLSTNDAPFMSVPLVQEFGADGFLTITDSRLTGLGDVIRGVAGAFYKYTSDAEEMVHQPDEFVVDTIGAQLPMSEGHKLLSLMSEKKVHVRIKNDANYSLGRTSNIIGRVEGSTLPEEEIVIGAHYDTEFLSPGVWDNGTGSASVLELARTIGEVSSRPSRTFNFILFGCEENGCWGSVNYVQDHKNELSENCLGMINLDSVGSKVTTKNTAWASESISDFIVETSEMVEWNIDDLSGVDVTFSDYAPFRDINIPNAWLGDWAHLHPYYHHPKDRIEYIDINKLHKIATVAELCGIRLANK